MPGMSVRRRVIAVLSSVAVGAVGLVGLAGPAQAVETITLVPGAYTPGQPWTVRVDGVPTMTEGNIYIFWLTFENLRGSRSNARPSAYAGTTVGEQTGAQCLAETGVSFSLASGPGNPAPNGGTYLSTTNYNGCSWFDKQTFRFAFSGATGLGNSSVIDVTFPVGTFTLPDSGGYAVRFTAGASQQFPLDRDCVGVCPVPVEVPVDPQGGTCRVTAVSGFDGLTAVAPRGAACGRNGFRLLGFSTESGGGGDQIALGDEFLVRSGLTLYARWGAVPGAPPKPLVTPGFGRVTVTFAPPTDTGGGVTRYEVKAAGVRTCTRVTAADPCVFEGLSPRQTYAFVVRAWSVNGPGRNSRYSDGVSPIGPGAAKGTRKKLSFVAGRGSSVKVTGSVTMRTGTIPPGTTIRPYICIKKDQSCRNIRDFVAGTGAKVVDSRGKYSFERRFAREHNRSTILIRMSGDGVNFTPVITLDSVA